jgi:hypothetical protein
LDDEGLSFPTAYTSSHNAKNEQAFVPGQLTTTPLPDTMTTIRLYAGRELAVWLHSWIYK